ncbi:MAG: NUDIX domain-containing protein [Acidimicrobiales bacterium]
MGVPSDSDLVDIVNDDDVSIGTIERGKILESGVNFRVSHVFILNSKDQLLLQQLGTVRTLQPFRWGSSVAAHVLANETYGEAARRRLHDELRIEVPLTEAFKIRIPQGTATKFVTLFLGWSDVATIGEPDHSASIEFKFLDWVRAEIKATPESFTDTFRALFESFWQDRAC